MKAQFWHERWQSGQLGFHQAEVNARLAKHFGRLGLADGEPVFVPLCGKSLDMAWIRSHGHPVVGVEFSPIAIQDFFDGESVHYSAEEHGALQHFSGSGYDLYCGDFFELEAADLLAVRGVYDRAALIALPPEMRERYAARMIERLPKDARMLLVTLEYDQSKMAGPPHSVPPDEIEALYGADFEIETLEASPPGEPPPPFQERGLDVWREHVLLLTRRGDRAGSE